VSGGNSTASPSFRWNGIGQNILPLILWFARRLLYPPAWISRIRSSDKALRCKSTSAYIDPADCHIFLPRSSTQLE
jgi:hypothetical protein